MVPLVPEPLPDLSGTDVFVGAGYLDRLAPPAEAERLVALLRQAGAHVTLHWQPGGHSLSMGEVEAARAWLADRLDEVTR
jgi:predicted esterase